MEQPDRFTTLSNGIELCYRIDGPDEGIPLVLIGGIGVDMVQWPQAMVAALAHAGFRVVRFDNRDCGRSSTIDAAVPSTLELVSGRIRGVGYDLGDMAGDLEGLLDHLGIDRAHIVGMSMGGMIGQTLAARRPDRVLSLTSIFSNTGRKGIGGAAPKTMALLARRPATDTVGMIRQKLSLYRHIASAGYVFDEPTTRRIVTESVARLGGADPSARLRRQIGAIKRSGDRTAELRNVTAPTLVIHGDRDLMVHPSGGAATRDAIAGARLYSIPGMGHDFHAAVVPLVVELIANHAGTHQQTAR